MLPFKPKSRDEVEFYNLVRNCMETKDPLPKYWFSDFADYNIFPTGIVYEEAIQIIESSVYNGEEIEAIVTDMDFTVNAICYSIENPDDVFEWTFLFEIKGYNRFRLSQERYINALVIRRRLTKPDEKWDYVKLQLVNGQFIRYKQALENKKAKKKDTKNLITKYWKSLQVLVSGTALSHEKRKITIDEAIVNLKDFITNSKNIQFYKGKIRNEETRKKEDNETTLRKKVLFDAKDLIEKFLTNISSNEIRVKLYDVIKNVK